MSLRGYGFREEWGLFRLFSKWESGRGWILVFRFLVRVLGYL